MKGASGNDARRMRSHLTNHNKRCKTSLNPDRFGSTTDNRKTISFLVLFLPALKPMIGKCYIEMKIGQKDSTDADRLTNGMEQIETGCLDLLP